MKLVEHVMQQPKTSGDGGHIYFLREGRGGGIWIAALDNQ